MILGSQGRFSTDLDFTGLEEHHHEDVILEMMHAFDQPFHGIQFSLGMEDYYQTQDGLSWGANPTYAHAWNASDNSEVKLCAHAFGGDAMIRGEDIGSFVARQRKMFVSDRHQLSGEVF
ncbi:MAG: hypothetical protein JWQ49_1085 [Edaphobacter sp.]|nr:hypothetical protein [Edaphobacter sp.]